VRVFSTPEDGEMRTLTLQIEENHRAVGKIPSESGWSLSEGMTNCMSGEEGGWHFGVSRCSGSCPEEVAIGFSGAPGSASGEQFVTTITGEIYSCGGEGTEGNGGVETFTLLITDDESAHITPNPANVKVSTAEENHWIKLTAKRYTESGESESGDDVVVDWNPVDDVDFAEDEGGPVMTDGQVDARVETFIWAKSSVAGKHDLKASTLGDSEDGGGVVIEGVLNVINADLRADFNGDDVIDNDDPNDPEEEESPGLKVGISETVLLKLKLILLPENLDSGKVTFAVTSLTNSGRIKIWKSADKADGDLLVDSGSGWKKEWILDSAKKFGDLPSEVYVEGIEGGRKYAGLAIILKYENSAGEIINHDKIKATAASAFVGKRLSGWGNAHINEIADYTEGLLAYGTEKNQKLNKGDAIDEMPGRLEPVPTAIQPIKTV
jgi:hypothetical protein